MEPPIFYSGQPHFHSSPSSLFTHWPPKASKGKIPSLAPPKCYWTSKGAPTSIENGLDSHMGALEHATVRSRTVAAPCQPPPATSGLPSVSHEAASASGTRQAAGSLLKLSPLPSTTSPECAVGRVHGAPRPPYIEPPPGHSLDSSGSLSIPCTSQTTSLYP